jgi:hypothetical protein
MSCHHDQTRRCPPLSAAATRATVTNRGSGFLAATPAGLRLCAQAPPAAPLPWNSCQCKDRHAQVIFARKEAEQPCKLSIG